MAEASKINLRMAESSKIRIVRLTLSDLIYEMAKKGTLRIPRFQRDYVWERSKVVGLLDSVYREFPIGSFFFWITPPEYRTLYKQIPELQLPEPADYEQIKLILDGQQRITSLFVAARGLQISQNGARTQDYRKICFDLDTKQFSVVSRTEDRSRIVSVWRFFDQAGEESIYDDLSAERRRAFRDCQKILTNYPLSVVEVEDKKLDDAIVIFERINQAGKRLRLFDLVVATTWSPDFDLKNNVNQLNSQFEKAGFGKIDEETITQTIALVVKNGHCTHSIQLQLTKEDIQKHWESISEGLKLAVDFAKENLGVRISEFLPYSSMLALLAYIYVKSANRALLPQQTSFVRDWFWKSAFSNRYAGAVLTKVGADVEEYFRPIVEGKPVRVNFPVALTIDEIRSLNIYRTSAIKNAILCLLALRRPRHFRNSAAITLDRQICSEYNEPEKHHIFPKAFLGRRGVHNKHLLSNFTFIPNELNQAIGHRAPSDYFRQFRTENPDFQETMDSHLIPIGEDSAIWTDDFKRFIEQRSNAIYREIEKLVGTITRAEVELQDAPVVVLDRLENRLRDFIDATLFDAANDYWSLVPQDIKQSFDRKLGEHFKRHPYEKGDQLTNRDRLDYLDVMDYCKIVLVNWPAFEIHFGSKGEVEKHFLNIKEFRNSLKHLRELNPVVRKQGEASVEWLQSVLNVASPVQEEENEEPGRDIAVISEEWFPLRKAYSFLDSKGLEDKATEIKSSKLHWKSYTSTLKRGLMIELLKGSDLLEEFIDQFWSFGGTAKGRLLMNRYLAILGKARGNVSDEVTNEAGAEGELVEEKLEE